MRNPHWDRHWRTSLSADNRGYAQIDTCWRLPDYLDELVVLEPNLLLEIVELFLQDTSAGMKLLQEELSGRDANSLARTLHGLKGSCRQIGGMKMGDILEAMESCLEKDGVDAAGVYLSPAESAFFSLRSEMEQRTAELANGQYGS